MSTAESQPPSEPRLPIIVMGVSGSGKTTVGKALARASGLPFFDGDDLHTPQARAKMAAGVALDDADRWPWLERIGACLADAAAHPAGVIIACSALRRIYRDRLRASAGPMLRFVYLEGGEALMRQRVARRKGHYMPASLVESQFAALEPPAGEGGVVTMAADAELSQAIPRILSKIRTAKSKTHSQILRDNH